MPVEYPDIIQCTCGQRMRLPADSQSNVFKCVKCGSLVDRQSASKTDTAKIKRGAPKAPSVKTAAKNDLLNIFVDGGLISHQQGEQIAQASASSGEKVFEILLRLGFATKEQLHSFLSRESGTAVISLAHFSIERSLTELIPVEIVKKHLVVPIDKLGKSLTAAMVCPMDAEAISAIEELTGLRVRPMLCTMEDFRAAVQKHYRLPDEDQTITVRMPLSPAASQVAVEAAAVSGPASSKQQAPGDRIATLETLAIPARVMNQTDAVSGKGAEGLRQITAIVSGSPPFGARVLSMANSAAFGLPGRVESIPMAVALLGDEAIGLIATGTPKLSSAGERQWFLLTRFSRHVAQIAAVLASASGRVIPNVAYCAGLLHAVGSYVLDATMPEKYQEIDPRLMGEKRAHAETQALGINHLEAGARLCHAWNLPEIISMGMRCYLAPGEAGNYHDIAHMLHIAVHLASPDGVIEPKKAAQCKASFDHLHLQAADILKKIGELVSTDKSAK